MAIPTHLPLSVVAASDADTVLPATLQRFRDDGMFSTPVIFGTHRWPEAVLIPFELYAHLLPAIEKFTTAELGSARS